jgi:hypothetical protein
MATGGGNVTPSPVQLLQLFFKKLAIELDEAHAPSDPPNPLTTIFGFDGITVSTEVGLAIADLKHANGQIYLVSLRVLIDNAARKDSVAQKFSPYKIDVAVHATVLIPIGAESLAPAEDLALVNGASLAWSAIREQVLNITSRMQAGPVTLPTMHFHDLKKVAESEVALEAKPESKRRRSKKV